MSGNHDDCEHEEDCEPCPGITNTCCDEYVKNAWWLPNAYVINATCACKNTPNTPKYNCIRKSLQDRMNNTNGFLKAWAASMKPMEIINPAAYQVFVQTFMTPWIYSDHVKAYEDACCCGEPAPYPAWVGVTSVPLAIPPVMFLPIVPWLGMIIPPNKMFDPCALIEMSIKLFGPCSGKSGTW